MDNKFTYIKERVLYVAEIKRISKGYFCEKIGMTYANFKGEAKKTPLNSDAIANILSIYPDISPEWLLTGNGCMLKSEDVQLADVAINTSFPLRTDKHLDMQNVPLYELDATAGLVELFKNSYLYVPVSHLQIPNLPPCDGALYVRGDSMYPILKSGDIVLYKQVNNFNNGILWGEMYLISFCINEEEYLSIKYIQKSETERSVRLVSHNGHHSPQDISIESVRALALIKASVRFNTMR